MANHNVTIMLLVRITISLPPVGFFLSGNASALGNPTYTYTASTGGLPCSTALGEMCKPGKQAKTNS